MISTSNGDVFESEAHMTVSSPDYDYAAFKDSGMEQADNGHYPDTFKLPNHITFSDQSVHHGVDGNEGGQWNQLGEGRWSFTPGATNFQHHTLQEMQEYFKKYESGNVLNAIAINRTPANDNKQSVQINPTPYEDALIDQSWKNLGKKLGTKPPVLEIVPTDKKSDSEEYQVAGDVVPLPINPFSGSDRRSTREEAAQFAVGDMRGSDPKIRSIGTNTVLDWVDRVKAAKGIKDK